MSLCPRCAAMFECGVAEGSGDACWCMELPPLAASDAADQASDSGCYCPACLRALKQTEEPAPPP